MMSFDDLPSSPRQPRESLGQRFILNVFARFVGNCLAIVVAAIIIFIGLHLYLYWRLEQIAAAFKERQQQAPAGKK